MRRSSHQPSDPAYYIEDCRIFASMSVKILGGGAIAPGFPPGPTVLILGNIFLVFLVISSFVGGCFYRRSNLRSQQCFLIQRASSSVFFFLLPNIYCCYSRFYNIGSPNPFHESRSRTRTYQSEDRIDQLNVWFGQTVFSSSFFLIFAATQGLNVSTTLIMAMGCQQCLPLSVVQLKGKHCRKPHCRNGVVDTPRQ